MRALPADYIPCYAESIRVCGKLTLSEENALALLRMAENSVTYRRTLEQIAANGTSNADLSLQALNALRDEPSRAAPQKRLVGIDTIKPRRTVRSNTPVHT